MTDAVASPVGTESGAGVILTRYRAADARALLRAVPPPPSGPGVADLADRDEMWTAFEHAPSFTVWVAGAPAVCLGWRELWPGRAHAWHLVAPGFGDAPASVLRAVVTTIRSLMAAHGLIRVVFDVPADFAPGHDFVRRLGFVPDGTPERPGLMVRYGPHDEDYQRYVLIHPRDHEETDR